MEISIGFVVKLIIQIFRSINHSQRFHRWYFRLFTCQMLSRHLRSNKNNQKLYFKYLFTHRKNKTKIFNLLSTYHLIFKQHRHFLKNFDESTTLWSHGYDSYANDWSHREMSKESTWESLQEKKKRKKLSCIHAIAIAIHHKTWERNLSLTLFTLRVVNFEWDSMHSFNLDFFISSLSLIFFFTLINTIMKQLQVLDLADSYV